MTEGSPSQYADTIAQGSVFEGPPVRDLVGESLGGCAVLRRLGQGGMATVYLAKQAGLDREVALKVLSPRLTQSPAQVEQFFSEAKTIAKLEHPNIVGIHQVGEEDGLHYLVLQYVAGGSLEDLLRARGRVDPATAVAYAVQIGRGLGKAHEAGIIHRDVKPGNVLVAGDTLKLTDFGLAQMSDGSHGVLGEGQVVGTPSYMSPEQIDARNVDARTDIYALGATLYQLLTGAPPFRADDMVELLMMHFRAVVKPPHEVEPAVPEALSRVVVRMLAKEPEARFPSMREVLTALEKPGGVAASEARQTLTVSFDEPLQPLATLATPIELKAPAPGWLRWAWAGALVAAGGLGALGAEPLGVVVGEVMGGEQATDEVAESEALVRLQQLDALLGGGGPPAERLAQLRAFSDAHPDTPEGARAGEAATTLAAELEAELAAEVERLKIRLDVAVEQADLGAALSELAAAPPAVRAELAAFEAELQAKLDAAGLAWVPTGDYLAGDEATPRPQRGFYVQLREVTCGDYAEFVRAEGARSPWGAEGPPDPRLPVTGVTAAEAQAYAAYRGMRLPTTSEWERAGRGTAGAVWPWGDAPSPGACNAGEGQGEAQPPGSFPRDLSPVGCWDMAGNVAEWTTGPRATFVIRGGSFATREPYNTRLAFFLDEQPADLAHPAVGFRCASTRFPGGAQ